MTAGVHRGADLVEVRLEGFPVRLHAATEQHVDELLREFAHIANAGSDHFLQVPKRLLALVADVRERYAPFSGAAREQIQAARMQGRSSMDLVYEVPPSVGPAAEELSTMLDEADEFCRQGHLLTLASTDEIVSFRHWLLGEFVRQVDGAVPQPWPPSAGKTSNGQTAT